MPKLEHITYVTAVATPAWDLLESALLPHCSMSSHVLWQKSKWVPGVLNNEKFRICHKRDGEGCKWNNSGGKMKDSVWGMWRLRRTVADSKGTIRYTNLHSRAEVCPGNIHLNIDSSWVVLNAMRLSELSEAELGPGEGVQGRWRVGLHGACFPECVEKDSLYFRIVSPSFPPGWFGLIPSIFFFKSISGWCHPLTMFTDFWGHMNISHQAKKWS